LNAAFNHGFAYWLYGFFGVVAALFVIRFVPETKMRSLEQIQNMWATRADQKIVEKAPVV
jgi:SP family xylose:H+ symportor-like MFS transporter